MSEPAQSATQPVDMLTPIIPCASEPLLHGIDDPIKVKELLDSNADPNAVNDHFETALHLTNNIDVAKLLIDGKSDVGASDQDGKTPLHHTNNVDIAQLLLDNNADPKARDLYGYAPLHKCKNPKIARLLLQYKANTNARSLAGTNPLHHAIDNYELVQLLMESRAVSTFMDNKGTTPIDLVKDARTLKVLLTNTKLDKWSDYSIRETPLLPLEQYERYINSKGTITDNPIQYDVVQLLLEAKADPNQQSPKLKKNILHITNDINLVQLLIDSKCDVNSCDNSQQTPIVGASLEKIKLLIKNNAKVTGLAVSPLCNAQSIEIIDYLIEQYPELLSEIIDPNQSSETNNKKNKEGEGDDAEDDDAEDEDADNDDDTATSSSLPVLHTIDNLDILHHLIKLKANLNAKDSQGYTPLHHAIKNSNYDIVRLLITSKANTTIRTRSGEVPISLSKTADMISLLIDSKIDPLLTNTNGTTLLHDYKATYDMVSVLLEAKMDPCQVSKWGQTPLHSITKPDVAKLLLDLKADPNHVDGDDTAPLHNASNYDIALLLLQYKADVTVLDSDNSNVLHRAAGSKIVPLYLNIDPSLMYGVSYEGISPMFQLDSVESAWEMFQYGMDPNHISEDGMAILSFPSSIHQLSLLLDFGGLPTEERVNYAHDDGMIQLLLLAKADPASVASNGSTILHRCQDHRIIPRLVNSKADVNALDNMGRTPLHCAANMQIFKVLLDYKANPDIADSYYRTPAGCAPDYAIALKIINGYTSDTEDN